MRKAVKYGGDSRERDVNETAWRSEDKSVFTATPFYPFTYSLTAEKSSRRFFCQHSSVLSVQTGFSFP
jgi:hypothetical protein